MRATIARPKDACPSSATAATFPAPASHQAAHRLRFVAPLGIALAAALAAAMLGALAPSSVLGGTSLDARCDGAALRSRPSSSSHREARLPRDARVVATRVVRGGHWKTQCGGSSHDGRKWYRVVSVNGKSVSRLYGQKAVYGARSLFDVVYIPLQTACGGVRLRTDTRTSAPAKIKLPAGARVIASGTVSGGRWTADCNGQVRGTTWYRVTKIGTQSVSAMFGVKALYAARSLLRSTAAGDAAAARHVRLHRGHRRQPLAGHDRLAGGGRGRQAVRVHEGVGGQEVRRPDLHDEPRAGERQRDQGRRLPLRQARHRRRRRRRPRPTTSSRRRAGQAATCCRSSTSRSPAGSDPRSCRTGSRRSSTASTPRPGSGR